MIFLAFVSSTKSWQRQIKIYSILSLNKNLMHLYLLNTGKLYQKLLSLQGWIIKRNNTTGLILLCSLNELKHNLLYYIRITLQINFASAWNTWCLQSRQLNLYFVSSITVFLQYSKSSLSTKLLFTVFHECSLQQYSLIHNVETRWHCDIKFKQQLLLLWLYLLLV